MQEYARTYLLQNYSTCFACSSHPSSGVRKTVTGASGTCRSIWVTNFLRRGQLSLPRWRKVVAQILWHVPEVAVTVLCSHDDRCDGHPKHVESNFAVNKYLHTVASCWILLVYLSSLSSTPKGRYFVATTIFWNVANTLLRLLDPEDLSKLWHGIESDKTWIFSYNAVRTCSLALCSH